MGNMNGQQIVRLYYDTVSCNIMDANGLYIGHTPNIKSIPEEVSEATKTDNMVKLVQAGFDQDDVIQMLREGLI